jgi:hypothetical protein
MISRRTTTALAFACLATLSVAVAADVRHASETSARAPAAPLVVELPRVVVTGKVVHDAAR